MDINDLTPTEKKLFIKVIKSGIEDEIFMENGENFFPLVAKGLVRELPNANYLSASVILTKKGKQLRNDLLKKGLI